MDVSRAAGTQYVTNVGADFDNNGVLDLVETLRTLRAGGGTNFGSGLQGAVDTFNDAGILAGNGNVIFVSDGAHGGGAFTDQVNALHSMNAKLIALGIGSNSSLKQLQQVDPDAKRVTSTDEFTASLMSVLGLNPIQNGNNGPVGSNVTIGGIVAGSGNVIANNADDGITVSNFLATGNSIQGNSIHDNGHLGIDLGTNGIDFNDPGDVDEGANHLQNSPFLGTVTATVSSTTVLGHVNGRAGHRYRIEFFKNSALNSTGHAEGGFFLGSTSVTANVGGIANFSVLLPAVSGNAIITATATDADGNTSEFSPGIRVSFPPSNITLTANSIAENSPTGTAIGQFFASDPNIGEVFTYSLVAGQGATDNSSFLLNGNSLTSATVFNFEAKSSYSIRVRVTDSSGLSYEKQFLITVSDLNEAPQAINLSNSSVPENRLSGTVVGTISATDPDSGEVFSYSLVPGTGSADNSRFTINGSELRTASSFDFETKRSYSIRLRVVDKGGLTFEKQVTINVTNVNESPTSIVLSSTVVAENQPSGSLVGNFTATDPESTSSLTYALVTGTGGTDNSRFTISGAALKTAAIFDYELKKSCSIRVRVTDAGGAFLDRIFTINVLNQLEGTSGVDAFVLSYTSTAVTVSMSINGATPISQGTFPLTSPLALLNLSSNDFVRVNGTIGNDVFALSSAGLLINNHRLTLNGPAKLTLAGAAGNETYRFDADSALGLITLIETSGSDTIDLSSTAASVALNLASGAAQVVNSNLSLTLGSELSFENMIGGSGSDRLTGNSLSNTLTGNAGNDILNGGLGSDLLIGGLNNDTYLFTTATAPEADQVTENTNEGIDTLNFAALTTSVSLHLGSSLVQTVHTNRTLKLNSPNTFENSIGGSGADLLAGNGQNNTLSGGPGDDKLGGGAGSDLLIGGLNNDTYLFTTATTAETDQVTENTNEGIDTLNFSAINGGVVLNLGTAAIQTVHANRNLRLNSFSTVENVIGGAGSDTLIGNALANRLTGGNGNNILVGLDGGDILEAGSGRDLLIGGLGLDKVTGGAGEDILIAGRTTSDASLTNLNTLRTQWTSGISYSTRIANIRAGVGSSIFSLKAKTNVLNDAGEDDLLTGGTGTDWYFRAVDDVITDLFAGEIIDVL